MLVKTLVEHSNSYSPAGRKKVGTEYTVDDKTAKSVLIPSRLVQEVKAKSGKPSES